MIDQSLIDCNITHLAESVRASGANDSGLRIIQQPFDQVLLNKIEHYLIHNNEGIWQPETTADYAVMTNIPRLKLSWHADTVIEEVHCVFDATTELINQLYPARNLKFIGITVWKDSAGYDIKWHTDNPLISVSMQIYLASTAPAPGTEFKFQDKSIVVPFVPNTGYIADNHHAHQLPHKTEYVVSDNCVRYSIFGMWTAQSQ